MKERDYAIDIEDQWDWDQGIFNPFLIKGLKYPVRNKSH